MKFWNIHKIGVIVVFHILGQTYHWISLHLNPAFMFSIFVEAMGVKGRFSEHLKLLYFVICISKKKSVLPKRGKDEICSYDNFVLTSVSNPRQNVKCQKKHRKNCECCPVSRVPK